MAEVSQQEQGTDRPPDPLAPLAQTRLAGIRASECPAAPESPCYVCRRQFSLHTGPSPGQVSRQGWPPAGHLRDQLPKLRTDNPSRSQGQDPRPLPCTPSLSLQSELGRPASVRVEGPQLLPPTPAQLSSQAGLCLSLRLPR
jgi:hypothetical protein